MRVDPLCCPPSRRQFMNQQRFFAVLTFLFVGAAVFIVLLEKVYDGDLKAVFQNGGVPTSIADSASMQDETKAVAAADSRIVLVKADEVREQLAAVPRLLQIPWTTSEIEAAFRRAGDRGCTLLPQNVYVTPLEPDAGSTAELKRTRTTAFTVGLKVDPAHRGELPSLSKNTIENYLADHVLAIQPTMIQDSTGDLFFDGTIHAAFYPAKSPMITVPCEPMIGEAVASFRTLGFYESAVNAATSGKLLVLAFKYIREQEVGGVKLSPQAEYELLFLYLPEVSMGPPRLVAFGTSNGRSMMEELDLGQSSFSGSTTIMANIRFQKYTGMGLYPASPVVLSVRNRSLSQLPLSSFLTRLAGDPQTPGMTLTQLFQTLHENPPTAVGAIPFPATAPLSPGGELPQAPGQLPAADVPRVPSSFQIPADFPATPMLEPAPLLDVKPLTIEN